MRANETYSEANRQFSAGNSAIPVNAQSPDKWWFTLNSMVFASSLLLPPLVGADGWPVGKAGLLLVVKSVGKADLLSDHF